MDDEYMFYIDVPESDVIIENKVDNDGYFLRIRFRDEETVERVRDLMERLRIYAKYRDR